jgi:hypothetical protein
MGAFRFASNMSAFRSWRQDQNGLSLIGLLVFGGVLALGFVLATRVFPTVTEYAAVRHAVDRAQKEGTDPLSIRQIFERSAAADSIQSVQPEDLKIKRLPSGVYSVSFDYEKRFPLFGPASLVIRYQGVAGVAADRYAKNP